MRISDWSSDVCSSDLLYVGERQGREVLGQVSFPHPTGHGVLQQRRGRRDGGSRRGLPPPRPVRGDHARRASGLESVEIGRASCRERWVSPCRSRWAPDSKKKKRKTKKISQTIK